MIIHLRDRPLTADFEDKELNMTEHEKHWAVQDFRVPTDLMKKFPRIMKECKIDDNGKVLKQKKVR